MSVVCQAYDTIENCLHKCRTWFATPRPFLLGGGRVGPPIKFSEGGGAT